MPYCREAVADVLGKAPEQYCDGPVALALAFAAYRRAAALSRFGDQCVGVAASCALVTFPQKRGDHRVHVAAHTSQGTSLTSVTLAKGERTRWQEDALASLLVIKVLAEASGCVLKSGPLLPLIGGDQPSSASSSSTPGAGPVDIMQESSRFWGDPLEALVAGHVKTVEFSWSDTPGTSTRPGLDSSSSGSSMDSSGDGSVPGSGTPADGTGSSGGGREDGGRGGAGGSGGVVLVDAPRHHLVVLPGSFQPLHEGHISLLATAVDQVNSQRVHGGDIEAQGCFELSIGNPDKGMLPLDEVRRRVEQFREARLPVIVTAAPRFTDKAPLFPRTHFVVGYDTAVRMVMPKYYGDVVAGGDETAMLLDFERLRNQGCRFLVAGRVDCPGGAFKTLDDVAVPPALSDLFSAIPSSGSPTSFRMDISSTEIRNKIMGSKLPSKSRAGPKP